MHSRRVIACTLDVLSTLTGPGVRQVRDHYSAGSASWERQINEIKAEAQRAGVRDEQQRQALRSHLDQLYGVSLFGGDGAIPAPHSFSLLGKGAASPARADDQAPGDRGVGQAGVDAGGDGKAQCSSLFLPPLSLPPTAAAGEEVLGPAISD